MFFLTLIYTYGQENNLEHPKNDSILPDSIEIIPKINRLKINKWTWKSQSLQLIKIYESFKKK